MKYAHGDVVAIIHPVQERADMAASFQYAAVEQLAHRLKYATEWARDEVPSINTLVVAGGVAANKMVRSRLDEVAEAAGYRTVYPQPRLCTDNGTLTDFNSGLKWELPAQPSGQISLRVHRAVLQQQSVFSRRELGMLSDSD